MSDGNISYIGVLLEEIREQNKAVLEAVDDMPKNVAKIPAIETATLELKQDMKIVKAAVTDVSQQQAKHDRRLSRLESV